MAVGTYALTSTDRLRSFMGWTSDEPTIDAFEIWNTSAGATDATFAITTLGITLRVTGGADAHLTTLTWVAFPTLDLLLAAIAIPGNATWGTTLLARGEAASSDMLEHTATSVLLFANRATTSIADSFLLELLIDAMTAAVETFCERQFMSRDYAVWVDGQEGPFLALDNYPVTAVSRLSISAVDALQVRMTGVAQVATVSVTTAAVVLTSVASGVTTTATLTFAANVTLTAMAAAINALGTGWDAQIIGAYGPFASADLRPIGARDALNGYQALELPWTPEDRYKIKETEGQLYGPYFARGVENVYVAYTGGYVTAPADLEYLVWRMCKDAYDLAQRDSSLKGETLGDYKWEAFGPTVLGAVNATVDAYATSLARWRRWM